MVKLIFKEKVPLNKLTTFKVGGLARYYCEINAKRQLPLAIKFAKENNLPIFILGGGSDILISDKGFNGLVLRYKADSILFQQNNHKVLVTAEAGLIWDKLVAVCVKKNLQGVECLSGIPGSVGAAPIQNIGAYGQEFKDTFVRLSAYDLKLAKFVSFDKKKCRFDYRDSIFKNPQNKGRYLIIDVTLALSYGKKPKIAYESLRRYLNSKGIKNPTLIQVRDAVITLRGQKLERPGNLGNAGSFFKNPIVETKILKLLQDKHPKIPYQPLKDGKVKLFAGWLIEQAGWKGKRYKNASVSKKNALIILNPQGKASAKDVLELSQKITSDVYREFKVKLEPEAQFIGFD